jgi:hypothetical protein
MYPSPPHSPAIGTNGELKHGSGDERSGTLDLSINSIEFRDAEWSNTFFVQVIQRPSIESLQKANRD